MGWLGIPCLGPEKPDVETTPAQSGVYFYSDLCYNTYMAWNPPESKREISDTLFCLGVNAEYQRIDTNRGHVWCFRLPDTRTDIDIYSPKFIRVNKKLYKNLYDVKIALMNIYKDKI